MKKDESYHQMKLVLYLYGLKSSGKIIEFYATINENTHSAFNREYAIRSEAKNQRMGKLKGVSDLTIITLNKVIYIELKDEARTLKSGKKSISHTKKSKEQIEFIDNINKSNACIGTFCYGYDEAKEFIEKTI